MNTKVNSSKKIQLSLLAWTLSMLFSLSGFTQNGVGINTNAPKSNLEINGSFGQKVTLISGSVTLDDTYNTVVCDNVGTAITIQLPPVSLCKGRVYVIKKGNSTADVTVDGNESETIDGATTFLLSSNNQSLVLFSDSLEWKTLIGGNNTVWVLTGNAGTDSTANFIGTTDQQALIIKTNNATRIKVTKDGSILIGNDTNHTRFEPDGTQILEGAATVWDDLLIYPDAATKSTDPPTWSIFKNSIYLSWFKSENDPNLENQVFFTIQIPHKYKVGTDLFPHVHWTTASGTPTRTNVVWGLEYSIMSIGGTFPNSATIYSTGVISEITNITSTAQHLISSFPAISGTGIDISTILVCRFFRNSSNGSDTFGNDAGLLSIDFHYQIDSEGSRTAYTK